MVRQEKDPLKHHKRNFKSLVKQNSIHLKSDVSFESFQQVLSAHDWFSQQPDNIKVLLFEYYVYKIRHKEIEKDNKIVKSLSDFLKKTVVKLTRETKVEQVGPLIDEKAEFTNTRAELRRRALDQAINEVMTRRGNNDAQN